MQSVLSSWNFCPKVKQSQGSTIPLYWSSCWKKSGRNGHKNCTMAFCSTRITHLHTRRMSLWQQLITVAFRSFSTPCIRQIWLPPTTFSFQTWKKVSVGPDMRVMMMSWMLLSTFLGHKITPSSSPGSKLLNGGGRSVLTYKWTTSKSKILLTRSVDLFKVVLRIFQPPLVQRHKNEKTSPDHYNTAVL